MDSIFGVGLPELILIAIIAGIIMGPERIVMGARWLGKTTSQLQGVSRSFFRQLNAEIDGIDQSGELRETMAELRREVNELRSEVMGVAALTGAELREATADLDLETVGTIAPPSLLPRKSKAPTNGQSAYRPPSLLAVDDAETQSATPAASALPRRVETSDDPE